MREIRDYLLTIGFLEVDPDFNDGSTENVFFESESGEILYSLDQNARIPNQLSAFYIWSGLGSHDDYAYRINVESVQQATDLLTALGIEICP